MDQPQRTCPACGSGDYTFRSRKKIAAQPDQGEAEAVETKYRCQSLGHEWKVRAPVQGHQKPEQF
jgi:hypothetical protein